MARITDREQIRLVIQLDATTRDVAVAVKQAGEANERAAKSEESAKQLNLTKLIVEKQLEETRKLVAEANTRADAEAVKRLQLEKQIADTSRVAQDTAKQVAPRRLTTEQRTNLAAAFKAITPKVTVNFLLDADAVDAGGLGDDIARALVESGFPRPCFAKLGGRAPELRGLLIGANRPPQTKVAPLISRALNSAGIQAADGIYTGPKMVAEIDGDCPVARKTDAVLIEIGLK